MKMCVQQPVTSIKSTLFGSRLTIFKIYHSHRFLKRRQSQWSHSIRIWSLISRSPWLGIEWTSSKKCLVISTKSHLRTFINRLSQSLTRIKSLSRVGEPGAADPFSSSPTTTNLLSKRWAVENLNCTCQTCKNSKLITSQTKILCFLKSSEFSQ